MVRQVLNLYCQQFSGHILAFRYYPHKYYIINIIVLPIYVLYFDQCAYSQTAYIYDQYIDRYPPIKLAWGVFLMIIVNFFSTRALLFLCTPEENFIWNKDSLYIYIDKTDVMWFMSVELYRQIIFADLGLRQMIN